MDNELFLKHALSVKRVHDFFIKEGIGTGHFLLLTEIVARKINKKNLPNIKWVQTELQISFTKVKAIIEPLEEKGIIKKIPSPSDKRVKYLDVTEKGEKYILDLIKSLPVNL